MNYSVLAVDSNDISVSIDNANDKTVGTSFISIVKGGWDLVSDFRQNPLGTIVSIIMEFLGGVADAIQWVDNLIQTGEFTNVLNSYDYLSDSDSDEDNLNKYTNVGDYEKGAKSVYGIDISKDENGNGKDSFTKKTEIPVPVGDLYNLSVGHIDVVNSDFFSSQNNKDGDNSKWKMMRNLAATLIRISLYFAGAILIISLIFTGVKIVKTSIDNPQKNSEYKKQLERFATSVLMLVGTVIIMALCVFGAKSLGGDIVKDDSYEYPIRLNVEDSYSFSTTVTGYFRYMSLTDDVDEWMKKVACTITYLILTIINFIGVILMLVTMLALWILAIIGPITAIMYIFKSQKFMSFGTWAISYVTMSCIQILLVVCYRVMLSIAIIV